MARTPGALNRRTRAALHATQTGELGGGGENPVDFLLRVMRNPRKPDALRIEAAKAVAPYLRPKLSAVEVTNTEPDDNMSEAEIKERFNKLLSEHPDLMERLRLMASADIVAQSSG